MHWLAKLNIASKLQLAPSLLITLLLLTAGAAYYGITQQQGLIDNIHNQRIKQYEQAFTGVAYAQLLIRETYATVQRYVEAGQIDPAELSSARTNVLSMADDLQSHICNSLAEPGLNEDEQMLYKQLDEEAGNLRQTVIDLFDGAASDGVGSLSTGLLQTRDQFTYVDTLYIDEVTRTLVGQSTDVEKSLAAGAVALSSSHEQLGNLELLFANARNSVDEVFQGIDSTANAVEEQSQGSQGIAWGIEHISTMADASNEVCRDTFQATQLLRSLADSLQSTTSRFNV